MIRSLAARFSEPSSYAGIAPIIAGIGWNVPPGLLQTCIYIAAGVCGLIAFILPEGK